MSNSLSDTSRRGFLKTSTVAATGISLLAGLSPVRAAHVGGNETIRIGLVGCGGRGRGAAEQALNTEGPTKLVAMADAFDDNLQSAANRRASIAIKLMFRRNDSLSVLMRIRKS